MQLELADNEAEAVDDILGMFLDGMDEEVPGLLDPEQDVAWQLYRIRQLKEIVSRVRMRLQLERRDDTGSHTRRINDITKEIT
jgi:hypothetical protein